MNTIRWRTGWCVGVCAMAMLAVGGVRAADPPGKAPVPALPAPVAAPPSGAGATVDDKDKVLREQTIYIPYEKLRKVFEKEGRGVFLPYEKFRELWQAAQDKKEAAADPKPPVGAIVTEIDSEATVAKDVVRVKAALKIEVLGEGWHEVPLRLADAAITEASLGGQPARIVAAADGGYKLLIENTAKKATTHALTLQYAKAISKTPGQNSVSFQAPQAPVNRWKVRIPESGVKVSLHPLIAATEVPAATGMPATAPEAKPPVKPEPKPEPKPAPKPEPKPAPKPEETVVLAFVGAAPSVQIDWTPKAEGATGLEALASVQSQQQVSISENVIRTRTQLVYSISRSELRQLVLEIPAGHKVAQVFDPNVRQWSVEEAAGVQKVLVQLFEPAKQTQTVLVELERYGGEKQPGATAIPVVKAVGVSRQQGVVVVQASEGLRTEVARAVGLIQIDAAELPAALARGAWAHTYRFVTVPYELELNVEKVQPRILADSMVEVELQPERWLVDMRTVYTIERAGVFRLALDIPAGYDVRQVRGVAVAGASEVFVGTHQLEGKEKTRLVVNLTRKAQGRVALAVQLAKDLREPDLAAATGKSASLPAALPRVAPEGVERATGRIVILAPEKLKVSPAKAEGLGTISFQEAYAGMPPARQDAREAAPVLAYAYTQDPASLVLDAERRKPHVTLRQLLVAQVEEGQIKYRATFFYTVLYAGVKSLRIDVPAAIGRIQNETRTIPEKKIDPQPANVPKDYVAWSFTGETELTGEGKIELKWETPLTKFDVGTSTAIEIPRLIPPAANVDRAWGQIVLVKAESIDLQEDEAKMKGLELKDPQYDLMPGASVSGGAKAFEFHEEWGLVVHASRYQLEQIKHSIVEKALLRMVVTRADKVSVQALYRMRSAQQRLALQLPEGATIEVQPRIDGTAVSLEKEAQGYLLPLTRQNPDRSFLLELRYAIPGDGSRLEYPVFPDDCAVQQVYLAAYLPEEQVLLSRRGPWTEEFRWYLSGRGKWWPDPRLSESQLLAWVQEGGSRQPASGGFATDGQMYLFSTLRPASTDEGALLLWKANEDWLKGSVLAVVVLAGLALTRARLSRKAVALAALAIALVLCGVFWPILARQLAGATFFAAVSVVLVAWAAHYAIRAGRAARAKEGRSSPPMSGPLASPDVSQAPDAAGPLANAVVADDATTPFGSRSGPDAGERGGPSHA